MPANKRDELIATAAKLFYKNGYKATGVQRILDESGLSKPTLYRHFLSKEALILAVLEKESEAQRRELIAALERHADSARERLLALFDSLNEWFQQPDFHGCRFLNAAIEFPECDHEIHQAATKHRRWLHLYLTELLQDAGAMQADATASELMILVDGATSTACVNGGEAAGTYAKAIAEMLLLDRLPNPD